MNGAFVHDDEIYVNTQNQTIECGHIPIDSDGPRCSCGSRGCLQAYLQDLDPNSVELRLALFEGLDEKLQEGDAAAKRTIERAAGYLVIAMKVLTRLLAPKSFLFVGCCETVAQALCEQVEHLMSEPDAFCCEKPRIFATPTIRCSPKRSKRLGVAGVLPLKNRKFSLTNQPLWYLLTYGK